MSPSAAEELKERVDSAGAGGAGGAGGAVRRVSGGSHEGVLGDGDRDGDGDGERTSEEVL